MHQLEFEISNLRSQISEKQAGVAQLVERQPSKLNVASSSLVSRSNCFGLGVEDAQVAQG